MERAGRAADAVSQKPDVIYAFRQAAPDHLTIPERAAEQVRQVRQRHRIVWSVVGGALLAVALGLWFGSDVLVELAVDRIPIEWEKGWASLLIMIF